MVLLAELEKRVDSDMPLTIEQLRKDARRRFVEELSVRERLEGLSAPERLEGLSAEEIRAYLEKLEQSRPDHGHRNSDEPTVRRN